jgi:ATP synthase protein I
MSDEAGRKTEEKAEEKASTGEGGSELSRRVAVMATRKLKGQQAQHQARQTIWSGLGMIGLVGWSVAVPTLLGATLGIWLDKNYPMNHSWTLTLLIIGLITGCLNAWYWLAREDRATHEGERQERGNKR